MASRIKLLPEQLINQIAAGEVVERPASILKELIDNSLDAGATKIEIDIQDGGRRLVRVTDNGCGLNKEELFLCLERHATSKLDAKSDLMNINTLGFRGEAMPSIASVSKMTITSADASLEGHKLTIEGGKIIDLAPCAANQGTTVEVRDLFYNVPARRKFLKTTATETAHLTETAQRYALSRTDIRLVFRAEDKEIINVDEKSDMASRILKILGRQIASGLRSQDKSQQDLRIQLWLAGPDLASRSSSQLFLYVLGRPVRDRLILKAVTEGYGRTLPHNRYPVGVIFIDLNPSRVDVNVHPAKTEVRFREPGLIFDFIAKTVAKVIDVSPLSSEYLRADIARPNGASDLGSPSYSGGPNDLSTPSDSGGPSGASSSSDIGPSSGPNEHSEQNKPSEPSKPNNQGNLGHQGVEGDRNYMGAFPKNYPPSKGQSYSGDKGKTYLPKFSMGQPQNKPPSLPFERNRIPPWMDSNPAPPVDSTLYDPKNLLPEEYPDELESIRPLAQLQLCYILAQGPKGLYIIDQHAAHERILYNQFKAQLKKSGFASQGLLFPLTIELSPHEALAAAKLADPLVHLGFSLEPFGGNTWNLRALPSIMGQTQAKEALFEMLQAAKSRLKHLEGAGLEMMLDDLSGAWLYSMACRAAVKAGDKLNLPQMESLLKDLAKTDVGGYCPHGRPSVITISLSELSRRFGRT
ncbi:MAG: DNA mismatch repair endonuclease MutL [Deltaproteobacteria bacterium]|jgi:DNA mismatch repair protein MutL|nr:DNA mismatch repair endonuclease MutL [Deltaproteobacteria bacterium]